LFTKNGKALTAKGVKPICPFQQIFQSTYLFGAFSPIDGNSFLLELPHCNSNNFQIFLDEFSQETPNEFKLMVLDNGAFHKAKSLNIPSNIGLLFLPPYSPELNPAEKMWANFKRDFTNRLFKTLDELSDYLENICKNVSDAKVKSICGFQYIFLDSFW
jgi:transposase